MIQCKKISVNAHRILLSQNRRRKMYLSDLQIEGYRLFKDKKVIHFDKGLNVLVGENGCGKSTVIDAIRLLLNEDEYARSGILEEDFYSSADKKVMVDKISIKGRFGDLSEKKKVEYITWLDKDYNAILNVDINKKQDRRNNYKKSIWGGESSNSIFEWEPLNDIQCVYLPALRDAERKLKASRGSRLARLLINLSQKELEEKRKTGNLTEIEKDVNDFNDTLSKRTDIARANELINDSLEKALGTIFAQTTKIQFGEVTFERIVEALRIVFFPGKLPTEESVFRNLFENSLGYNNLIYLATILAEFEGLKENYTSPRILLIEELEAHLHPQIQIKVLKYLKEQADKNEIQVIITTHSTIIASTTPVDNIISFNTTSNGIKITSLKECVINKKAKQFINRWLDATRSTLLFSKGNILVEGLAEALLVPKLAELYLAKMKKDNLPRSLEEAGISVINMNGIYFQYFLKLYDGYEPICPEKNGKETKEAYANRIDTFRKKEKFENEEYKVTDTIPIRVSVITDNDPDKEAKPNKDTPAEGNNPQLFLMKQVKNMTNNCRIFKNLKTFEYELSLEKDNAKIMISIILDLLTTNGDVKKRMEGYLDAYLNEKTVNQEDIAYDILMQIDSSYIGKGVFAQLLLEKLDESNDFIVPDYIKKAINFVLNIDGE